MRSGRGSGRRQSPAGRTRAPPTGQTGSQPKKQLVCYNCGGVGHFRKHCPTGTPVPGMSAGHTASKTMSMSKTPVAKGKSSRKRTRDELTPGTTPPTKRPAASTSMGTATTASEEPRFSYAKIATDALAVVVLAKDGTHVTRTAFNSVQRALTDDYLARVTTEAWLPEIEAQRYNSKCAVIVASDAKTQAYLLTEIPKLGYEARPWTEYRKEVEDVRLFSGLVTGQTAHLRREKLDVLLADQCKKLNIGGVLKIYDTHLTNTGAILRLKANSEAAAGLKRVDCTLRLALAGKVLFTEVQTSSAAMKLDRREVVKQKLHKLEQEIAREKALLEQLEEDRLRRQEAEKESASGELSEQLSHLEVDDPVAMETTEEKGDAPKVSDADDELLS